MASARDRRQGLAATVIAGVSSVLLGLCWALASPLSGTPDEDFHLATIWCAWGDDTSQCRLERVEESRRLVDLPALEGFGPCFKFDAATSAACQAGADSSTQALWAADNGSYPTGFYRVMGLMASDSAPTSVLLMRLTSFVSCAAMLIGAALLLPFGRRVRARVLLVVTAVAVPLGLFLFASINPSGVAIAAETSLFISALAALMSRTWRRTLACGLFGATMILVAAASRPDGVFVSVILLALAAGAGMSRRTLQPSPSTTGLPSLAWATPPLVVALVVAWLSRPGTVQSAFAGGQGGDVSLIGNLLQIPALYVGDFPTKLGWLDTQMPASVWALQALILGMLVAIAMARADRRRLFSLSLAVLVLLLVPLLWLTLMGARVGEWVQPRYVMPLLLAACVLAIVPLPQSRTRVSRTQAIVIATSAVIGNAVALHTLLRRNVTGVDVEALDLDQALEWWWGFPVGPNSVRLVGAASGAALLICLAILATQRHNGRFHGRGSRSPGTTNYPVNLPR